MIQAIDLKPSWDNTADKLDQILLAYTQLSTEQISLLCEKENFAQHLLTGENLTHSYLSGSSTETVYERDISRYGYIIQAAPDTYGPTELTENSAAAYDMIEVVCRNQSNDTISVKLRGENVITYHRVKARMVPFDNTSPFTRQLKLTYYTEDNPTVSGLDKGPYFANITIYAAEPLLTADALTSRPFLTITYRLAMAEPGTPAAELEPEAKAFFINNYGLDVKDSTQLNILTIFGDQTGVKATDIENILGLGDYLPIASPNVVFRNTIFTNGQSEERLPSPYHYGGLYINARQQPSMKVVKSEAGREIYSLSHFRLERLSRYIRLQRWLGIPFYQLDLLLASAMQAEKNNTQFEITPVVIQSLGLFRHLSLKYNVTPETYSTWVYHITPFSISIDTAFFDKIFNKEKLFDQPFILDDGVFSYKEPDSLAEKSIKQICSGLGISLVTFQLISPLVQNALGLKEGTLARRFDVVSSLYRLVSIPKLFGLTTEDGLILMSLIANDIGYLAAQPVLDDHDKSRPNLFHVILKMEALSRWMSKTSLTSANLALWLEKTKLAIIPTDNMVVFLKGIAAGLSENVCLKESDFQRQELEGQDWWELLGNNSIIDNKNGLVLDIYPTWGETDESLIRGKLKAIDPGLSDNVSNILVQLLLSAKSAQDNLLSQAIAAEYGVDRAIAPLQLQWLGASVYHMLEIILQGTPENKADIGSDFTELTYKLLIYTQFINTLKINKQTIFLRLAKPEWLGLPSGRAVNLLSMDEIYLISRYQDLVAKANQSEDKILEYLSYANQSMPARAMEETDMNKKCAELLAEILDWNAGEIEKATSLSPFTLKQAKNVMEIDWLRRLQELTIKTKLSVDSLWDIGLLTITSDFSLTERVGDAVMAALKAEGES